jgi:hypothetical protein
LHGWILLLLAHWLKGRKLRRYDPRAQPTAKRAPSEQSGADE